MRRIWLISANKINYSISICKQSSQVKHKLNSSLWQIIAANDSLRAKPLWSPIEHLFHQSSPLPIIHAGILYNTLWTVNDVTGRDSLGLYSNFIQTEVVKPHRGRDLLKGSFTVTSLTVHSAHIWYSYWIFPTTSCGSNNVP